MFGDSLCERGDVTGGRGQERASAMEVRKFLSLGVLIRGDLYLLIVMEREQKKRKWDAPFTCELPCEGIKLLNNGLDALERSPLHSLPLFLLGTPSRFVVALITF